MRILFLCLLLLACPAKAEQRYEVPASINILAVASLAPALAEIARDYTASHSVSVIFVFDSPYALATRIENGEAADLFIADHPKWLEGLKQKGLLDVYSDHAIGHNRLILTYPTSGLLLQRMPAGMDARESVMWLAERSLFVIGDAEGTSLGIYAEQALKTLGIWNRVKDRAIRAQNSQQAAFMTAENPAAGILYESELTSSPRLSRLAVFPEDTHEPITYTAAAVAGENMQAARQFLEYLQTEPARAVFRRYGISG